MTMIEKLTRYLEEHHAKVQELNSRIQSAEESIEYLTLEIRFIQTKELPDAQTKRVLEGTDRNHESKLQKKMTKLQEQLQEQQEAIEILNNAIKKLQIQAGDDVANMERQFREERQLTESKQYSKMMYAKKQYVEAIMKEAEVMREYHKADTKLQELLNTVGRRNGVYSEFTVKSANNPSTIPYNNGVYLALHPNEVVQLVKGTNSERDLEYLQKYANKKDLS